MVLEHGSPPFRVGLLDFTHLHLPPPPPLCHTRQIQPRTPLNLSRRPLYSTNSAPGYPESLQSSPTSDKFSPRVHGFFPGVPYTRQIQPQNPSSRPLYPTDSVPVSLPSLQSPPIPHRFSPRVSTIPPVVPCTTQIQPQNP